jgi:hypothetical protein
MIKDLDKWAYEQQAKCAELDMAIKVVGGREWSRNHPKVCPWCGSVFYAYKPLDTDWQPFQVDPEPKNVMGVRETCGHPICWKSEDDAQFKRAKAWRDSQKAAKAEQPVQGRLAI